MRVFNGTEVTIDLPYSDSLRVSISPKSVSTELYCDKKFIETLITTYTPEQVALIISGPEEVATCAAIPTAVEYVCDNLDDAYNKFNIPATMSEEGYSTNCSCRTRAEFVCTTELPEPPSEEDIIDTTEE